MGEFKYFLENGWNKKESELYEKTASFIHEHFPRKLTDEEIKNYFNEIKNKNVRINDLDKKWVACDKLQEHEKETAINAIWEIIEYKLDAIMGNLNKELIYEKAVEVCTAMNKKNISHKPRIVFYILVLKLLKIER